MFLFYSPARNARFESEAKHPCREGDNQENYTRLYEYPIRFISFGVSKKDWVLVGNLPTNRITQCEVLQNVQDHLKFILISRKMNKKTEF